ncbi:MAG: CoA transferase subunit A [Burkholderiales bacterium]
MTSSIRPDIASLVTDIPHGAMVAVPKDTSGVAMTATRALVRRGIRDLHLICVPTSGLQADLLIGAGAVRTIETSAVTLGEYGTGPRFVEAVQQGRLVVKDATCPAIYAALQAGEKGLPFIPLRGLLGTDVLRHRADWKVIDNPFAGNDPIVALPAIRPDVALFHARMADRFGNVFIGREREVLLMAHAARSTLVTVDDIVDGNLLEDPARAGAVLPAIYVSGIAIANRGTWPLAFDQVPEDSAALGRYAALARTPAGFMQCLAEWDHGASLAA